LRRLQERTLRIVTIHDYHIVMKNSVGIAELKSRLSEYLRMVRRGKPLTIMDRERPVARLVPYIEGTPQLIVREAARRVPRPADVALPAPIPLDVDVVRLLLEERGER
jgi:prevent-host-death family protein